MCTHDQLATRVKTLYREYGNETYCRPSFIKVSKKTLQKLIQLHAEYDNRKVIPRPPTPPKQKPRGEACDAYKHRMQCFFQAVGCPVPVSELNVPQTENIANFLAGIRNPGNNLYEANLPTPRHQRPSGEDDTVDLLSEYACAAYFPLSLSGLRMDRRRHIGAFLRNYTCRQKIRPPLPKNRKLLLDDYYQYRRRAQAFFDKVGFPVAVEYLTLPMIEALLNFMVGNRHPRKEMYRKVFAANSIGPVSHFVAMYKPYENSRYPISVGQFHGKRKRIVPLLYFSPQEPAVRWFAPPPSTKIKNGRARLFLNYQIMFDRLGITVEPHRLPIAYIEAVLTFAEKKTASQPRVYPKFPALQQTA